MDTTEASDETTDEAVPDVVKYYSAVPRILTFGFTLMFFVIFVLNVIVGHALYKARRLKPVLRVLLFNLAVIDAITGIVNVYHMIFVVYDYSFTVECIIRYGLVIEMMSVTLFFIVVLSVDRVVALVSALRYAELVTTKRLWGVSLFVWIFSLVFPLAGLVGVDMENKYCIFQLFLPRYSFVMYGVSSLAIIAGVVVLNGFMLKRTLGHIERIADTVVGEDKNARVAAMNYKAAVTSLAIVIPFVVLCSPQYILFLVLAFMPELRETLKGLIATSVCLGLVISNSLLNPFIYVWRSREVRSEVKRFLCLRKLFPQTADDTSQNTARF